MTYRSDSNDPLNGDDNTKLSCPVCGQIISDYDEGSTNPCEHVAMTYVDILPDQFLYVQKDHMKLAMYMIKLYKSPEMDIPIEDSIDEFVQSNDNYTVVSLRTSGLSCGPCSCIEYNLIKVK